MTHDHSEHISEHTSEHIREEDLVLIYYREPGVPAEAAAHLSRCALCRASFDALAETLNTCLDWTPPEPGLDFERSVWAQLVPQLEVRRVSKARRWLVPALAVLALAFFAGRWSSKSVTPIPLTAGLSDAARERIFAISMADHLGRAEVLLTSLENIDEGNAAEFGSWFSNERQPARDLVSEGRLMREMATERGDTRMMPVLDEIERLVLEVANAPEGAGRDEIRGVKRRIGADWLLFKVRIIESNLRSEGDKI